MKKVKRKTMAQLRTEFGKAKTTPHKMMVANEMRECMINDRGGSFSMAEIDLDIMEITNLSISSMKRYRVLLSHNNVDVIQAFHDGKVSLDAALRECQTGTRTCTQCNLKKDAKDFNYHRRVCMVCEFANRVDKSKKKRVPRVTPVEMTNTLAFLTKSITTGANTMLSRVDKLKEVWPFLSDADRTDTATRLTNIQSTICEAFYKLLHS